VQLRPDLTPLRAGQLTVTWRILLALGWSAAFFAYAAVWQASVQLGIGTWWIGPRAQPTPTLVRLVPFIACLGVVLLVVYGRRWLPIVGVVVGLGLTMWSLPDFSRSTSLALTELIISSSLVMISAVSWTGLVRAARHGAEPTDDGR